MAKTTGTRLAALKQNKQGIADKLAKNGAQATPTDGLAELVVKAGNTVVPAGAVAEAVVSAAGTIYAGDYITVTKEFKSGDQLRIANGNSKLVTAKRLRDDTVIVVYAQDGSTYLKTAKHTPDGSWTLGNSLLLTEGDELGTAVVVIMDDNTAAVIYSSEGAGQLSRVSFAGLTATIDYTDIWDAYDPENICAARDDFPYPQSATYRGLVAIGFMRTTGGAENGAWKYYLLVINVGEHGMSLGPPCELEVTEKRVDPDTDVTTEVPVTYDSGVYLSRAWDIAVHGSTIYLTVYRGYKKLRGLVVAGRSGLSLSCVRYEDLVVEGSLPSCAMVGGTIRPGPIQLEGIAVIAHGITRVSGSSTKSLLALECWYGPEEAARLLTVSFGEEDATYLVNIGRVCLDYVGKTVLAAGYSINNTMRVMAVDVADGHMVGGPSQNVASFDACAELVGGSASRAYLAYQSAGSCYLKELKLCEVVTTCNMPEYADGVAMVGGGSGSTIKVKLK